MERARELRILGMNQYQIVDKMNSEGLGPISQQGVSYLLKTHDQRVIETLISDDRERKVQQLEKLEYVYAEAVQAWLKSKEAYRMLREKEQLPEEFHPPEGEAPRFRRGRKETVQELRDQHGERGFLTEARDALSDIRELLGLNAPKRVESSGPDGGPMRHEVAGLNFADVPDDRLAQLDGLLEEIAGGGPVSLPNGRSHGAGPA